MNKEHFDAIFKVAILFMLFAIMGGIWYNNGLTSAQITWLKSIDDNTYMTLKKCQEHK